MRASSSRLALSAMLLAVAIRVASGAEPAREAADLVIVHARVLTVDAAGTVHDPGGIAVRSGAIVGVGPSDAIERRFEAAARWDAGGKIVLPGLVNTHGHAAMTLMRGLADDLPLDRWLTERIFPAEARNLTPQFVYDGTRLAALEMIRGGTTTFADMYYFETEAARAADEAGLRAVLGETWIDFPVPSHKDAAEAAVVTQALIRRWKGHPRIVPGIAAHAPYTCSRETLLAVRDLARKEHVPIQIHVAETRKELDDARAKWGSTPVGYLEAIGFFDGTGLPAGVPVVMAHAVWVDAADRAALKRRGVAVAHNPESNMKLGSGAAPIAAMAAEGLLWSLGTDGPAGSNNDLSLFEAMDFAGKLAKVTTLDPTALPAAALVAAATRSGAQALGLGDRIGSIETGKRADLIAVDVRNAHVEPLGDLASTLVYAAKASDVTDVWVDGRRLLDNGRPTTLDERAILEAAIAWRRKIDASLASAPATR